LIERSPADIWLSILALAFVVRLIIKRDGEWREFFWVKASFVFLAVCIVSSALSVMPFYSFSEGVVWFRFLYLQWRQSFGPALIDAFCMRCWCQPLLA